jgi:hypothetical protein
VLDPPEHHGLDGFPVVTGGIAALLDRRLPQAQSESVRVDELRGLTLFLPSPKYNPYFLERVERFAAEAGLTRLEQAVGVSAPPRAVYEGKGFAVWPTALSAQYAPMGVAVVPIANAHQPTAVWFVYRDEAIDPALRHILESARRRSRHRGGILPTNEP